MPGEDLGCGESYKAIDVEHAVEFLEASGRIGFLCGSGKGLDVLLVQGFVARIFLQLVCNVSAGAFVKVAFGPTEVFGEKFFVHGFFDDVETQIAPIQLDVSVVVARRGHSCGAEKVAANRLADERGVLA